MGIDTIQHFLIFIFIKKLITEEDIQALNEKFYFKVS